MKLENRATNTIARDGKAPEIRILQEPNRDLPGPCYTRLPMSNERLNRFAWCSRCNLPNNSFSVIGIYVGFRDFSGGSRLAVCLWPAPCLTQVKVRSR